jgi:hypothetical protein
MPYLRLGATDLVWRRAKNGVNSALCASPLALLGASPAGVLRHRVAQSGDGVAGQARFATGVSHMWRTPRTVRPVEEWDLQSDSKIRGRSVVLHPPEMVSIPLDRLGALVGSLGEQKSANCRGARRALYAGALSARIHPDVPGPDGAPGLKTSGPSGVVQWKSSTR